jgi:hypothetical protein
MPRGRKKEEGRIKNALVLVLVLRPSNAPGDPSRTSRRTKDEEKWLRRPANPVHPV